MAYSKYQNSNKVAFLFLILTIVVLSSYLYAVNKRQTHFTNMVNYHNKMIKLGNINSLVSLGKMYEKGEGVKKDLSKAQELFKKAINFNQYLDEIYPTYSKSDAINDSSQYSNNLNKIISNVKKTSKKIKVSIIKNTGKIRRRKQQTKTIYKTKKLKPAKSKTYTSAKSSKKRHVKYTKAKKTKQKKVYAKLRKNKLKTNKKRYKKTNTVSNRRVLSNQRISLKNKNIQAKRARSLYEERTDYELDIELYEEDIIFDVEDETVITTQKESVKKENKTDKKQKISKNFSSNPCKTAAARYIAKCRRRTNRR